MAQAPFWGLLLLLAWAPLPFASNRPWSWSLLSLAVGVLLVLWAIAFARRPHLLRLSWRRMLVPAAPFGLALAWAFLQTTAMPPAAWHDPLWGQAGTALGHPLAGAISSDPAGSAGGAMRLMAYAGIFWLATQYGRDPRYARRIVRCVVLAGIGYAAYGLAVFASGNRTILWFGRWAYDGDLSSTFVSRAAFGAYAALALLCALALLFRTVERAAARDREGRRLPVHLIETLPAAFYGLVAGCMTLATAMMLTHSRGAVAVAAIGIAVMLAALFLRKRQGRRHVIAAALCIAVAGVALLDMSGRVTLGRVLSLADQGTGREAIHALAERAIEAAPLAGHGLDTFGDAYFRYRDMAIPWDSPRYDKAHSPYLELAMELGLVGFSFFMAALAVILVAIAAGVARRRRGMHYPILGLAATALLAAHSWPDFSIQMPAVAATYAALLGVAFAQSWSGRAANR